MKKKPVKRATVHDPADASADSGTRTRRKGVLSELEQLDAALREEIRVFGPIVLWSSSAGAFPGTASNLRGLAVDITSLTKWLATMRAATAKARGESLTTKSLTTKPQSQPPKKPVRKIVQQKKT